MAACFVPTLLRKPKTCFAIPMTSSAPAREHLPYLHLFPLFLRISSLQYRSAGAARANTQNSFKPPSTSPIFNPFIIHPSVPFTTPLPLQLPPLSPSPAFHSSALFSPPQYFPLYFTWPLIPQLKLFYRFSLFWVSSSSQRTHTAALIPSFRQQLPLSLYPPLRYISHLLIPAPWPPAP